MHLHTRNVNTAFRELVEMFNRQYRTEGGREVKFTKKPSRNGNVIQIDEPIIITYECPLERVLFNAARDANPFFHLYEALWMLAGRNDVASVAYYAKQMKEYSDDGKTLNGAYGARWRGANGPIKTTTGSAPHAYNESIDQLDILVAHLKADPTSRRAVLQMWNVEDDLLKIGLPCNRCGGDGVLLDHDNRVDDRQCPHCRKGMKQQSKDVCCNLSVMFSLRTTYGESITEEYNPSSARIESKSILCETTTYLDMTVTNRSNDLIWGLLGANYVHFTFLQEYVAARLGVEVGRYHHFTNNLHSYDWNWEPEKWLGDKTVDMYQIPHTPLQSIPLVRDPATFDQQVKSIVETYKDNLHSSKGSTVYYSEPFLMDVAQPAFQAFGCHKSGLHQRALEWAISIKNDDWRIACENWLKRRAK